LVVFSARLTSFVSGSTLALDGEMSIDTATRYAADKTTSSADGCNTAFQSTKPIDCFAKQEKVTDFFVLHGLSTLVQLHCLSRKLGHLIGRQTGEQLGLARLGDDAQRLNIFQILAKKKKS